MRPIPVPDYLRNTHWVEGTDVFSAPDGDLTSTVVAPAEGLYFRRPVAGLGPMVPMVGVVLTLEDPDVEAIEDGARHVLMSWLGRSMPVFLVPEVIWEGRAHP